MKEKQDDSSQIHESIVPFLEVEEAKLSDYLKKGREEGEKRLHEAEKKAENRLSNSAEELKIYIEKERIRRMDELHKEFEKRRIEREKADSVFEQTIRSRINDAASRLLSLLFGGASDDR